MRYFGSVEGRGTGIGRCERRYDLLFLFLFIRLNNPLGSYNATQYISFVLGRNVLGSTVAIKGVVFYGLFKKKKKKKNPYIQRNKLPNKIFTISVLKPQNLLNRPCNWHIETYLITKQRKEELVSAISK
jgi:hypothetical protein